MTPAGADPLDRTIELTAEAPRAQSEEFLIKKYSDFCIALL
jgi:hypothetical protein